MHRQCFSSSPYSPSFSSSWPFSSSSFVFFFATATSASLVVALAGAVVGDGDGAVSAERVERLVCHDSVELCPVLLFDRPELRRWRM